MADAKEDGEVHERDELGHDREEHVEAEEAAGLGWSGVGGVRLGFGMWDDRLCQ